MQFLINCRVTLDGAVMVVEADTVDEALAKAKAHDWIDLEYDGAELVDWTIRGKPKKDE